MIKIIDANNHFRLRMETSIGGNPLRDIYAEVSTHPDTVFVIWDGEYGNSTRRKIYPDYKKHRKPPDKDLYVNFDMIYELMKFTRAIQIRVPYFEGDDVVAQVARHNAKLGNPVHINSTDKDFLQLQDENPDLIYVDAKLIEGLNRGDLRYYKTLVGDTSDNIKGIAGFGDKSWKEADKTKLRSWVDALVNYQELPEFDFPKRCQTWLQNEENLNLIRAYWNIIGFLEVPNDVLGENMNVGQYNYRAADEYLKRFML